MAKASCWAWNGASPMPGWIDARWIFSGVLAATSSMSMPPSALAIRTGCLVERSTSSPM